MNQSIMNQSNKSVNLWKLLLIGLLQTVEGKCFLEHEDRSGSRKSIIDLSEALRFRIYDEEFEHDCEECNNLAKIIRKTFKWFLAEETRLVGRVHVNHYSFGMKLMSCQLKDTIIPASASAGWNGIKQYEFQKR